MGMILLAYASSVANGSALVDVASVVDAGVATQSGNGYVIDKRMKKLYAAWGVSAYLSRLQVQCPLFNLLAYQEVTAKSLAAAAAYERNPMDFYGKAARALNETETLIVQAIQSNSLAAEVQAFVMVGDADPAPSTDPYFTVRWTGTTTLTADAWSNVSITLDRNLPKGSYKIVGARMRSAGALAFRVNLPGDQYRPGGMAVQVESALDPEGQRGGGWGVWGSFDQNLLPTIDVFSTSADTAEYGEFDLVKV